MPPLKPSVSASISAASRALGEALACESAFSAAQGVKAALRLGADPDALTRPAQFDVSLPRPLALAAALDRPWAMELIDILLDAGANPVITEDASDALRLACRYGSQSAALGLVKRGQSTRLASKSGWTAFLCAAAANRFDLCAALSEVSSVNAHATDGSRLMRVDAAGLFIQNKNPEAALRAYTLGWGDPDLAGNSLWTPIMRAIHLEADELVSYLARYAKRDARHVDCENQTALHHAVAGRREDYARVLIESGDPLDILDRRGLTPLSKAISVGALDCVSTLLELGANPATRAAARSWAYDEGGDFSGMDAICVAANSSDMGVFKLMAPAASLGDRMAREAEYGGGALHFSAGNDDHQMGRAWTETLLGLGWDPNALDRYGQTPLFIAISQQSYGALAALLPVSDLSARSSAGITAMEMAANYASAQGKSGPLNMINAYLEREALLKGSEAGAAPTRPEAQALKPKSI